MARPLLCPIAARRDGNVPAVAQLSEADVRETELLAERVDRGLPNAFVEAIACDAVWHGASVARHLTPSIRVPFFSRQTTIAGRRRKARRPLTAPSGPYIYPLRM